MYSECKSYDFAEYDGKLQSSTENCTTKPVEKPVETVNNLFRNVRKTRKHGKSEKSNSVKRRTFYC